MAAYMKIQLPIILLEGMTGIRLFCAHQFKPSYWTRHERWNSVTAAIKGSSCYRLPKVLQGTTGNIGLHHIHHLRPGIPNYNPESCLRQIPEEQKVRPLTFMRSLRSLRMILRDETKNRLISFRSIEAG